MSKDGLNMIILARTVIIRASVANDFKGFASGERPVCNYYNNILYSLHSHTQLASDQDNIKVEYWNWKYARCLHIFSSPKHIES